MRHGVSICAEIMGKVGKRVTMLSQTGARIYRVNASR